MINQLKVFLSFLNLLDRSGSLSITNTAVYVLLVKMSISPFDWAAAAALMVTLLNYAHKRSNSLKTESNASTLPEVPPVDLGPLQAQLDSFKSTFESVAKTAEETKKLLSQSNLAQAFTRK